MFERLELTSSFKDRDNCDCLSFNLIDSTFVSSITLYEHTGNKWDPTITYIPYQIPQFLGKVPLYDGILWSIYDAYKCSKQPICFNMPIVIRDLFYHIPSTVKKTTFNHYHYKLVNEGLKA